MPKIQLTDSTLALHNKAWAEGTSLKISAIFIDEIEPFVQSAILCYKKSNQNYFTSIKMNKYGDDKFYAIIPSSVIQAPGVSYM